MADKRNVYVLAGKHDGNRLLGRRKDRWKDIKTDVTQDGYGFQPCGWWPAHAHTVTYSGVELACVSGNL